MVLQEAEVSEYLQLNPRFSRSWFLQHAPTEWVNSWLALRRTSSYEHSEVNTSEPTEISSPTQSIFSINHIRSRAARGSITSDMFARHLQRQQSSQGIDQRERQSLSVAAGNLDERELLVELIRDIAMELNVDALCYKILMNVNLLTKSDRGSLFLAKGGPGKRCLISKLFDVSLDSSLDRSLHSPEEAIRVPFGVGIAGHVAETKEIVNIPDCYKDPRFNQAIDKKTGYETHSMLCMPILNFEREVIGVAQIINKNKGKAFNRDDERVFAEYLNFCGIGLTNAQLFQKSVEEYKKNLMLLRLARNISKEQNDLERLIATIMRESVDLLGCERCMVYLVEEYAKCSCGIDTDEEKDPLGTQRRSLNCSYCSLPFNSINTLDEIRWSKIFEITNETLDEVNEIEGEVSAGNVEPETIPKSVQDLAFKTAHEGLIKNIEDFEAEIKEVVKFNDERPVRGLLCVPIFGSDKRVIGVTQLINKDDGQPFTENDINTFETFAIFVGISIHNCHIYENVQRLLSKQKVTFDVLSYHASSQKEEVDKLKHSVVPSAKVLNLYAWEFDDRPLSADETLCACIRMFSECGVLRTYRVPYEILCRWLCSVKKNYRDVTYHNWRHAFNVAQSMFTMLYTGCLKSYMSKLDVFGLLVACLCHDLDHRGTNNTFQVKTESPLAKLYTTSVMENHHFDQCIMIINAEGNNIFQCLTHSEYKKVIVIMRDAILSTDLAVYFKKRSRFSELVKEGGSDLSFWGTTEHKDMLRSMMMTACDLAATTKPWEIQYEVAQLVAAEFFEQGDIEKEKLHQQPIPMMDREKKDELPKMQVGFIETICMPLYEAMSRVQPTLLPMYTKCLENQEHWARLAENPGKSS